MGRQIAPYGGLDGKPSTNPIAFAAPRRVAEPILVDMTTSVCAEGKIRVASNKGRAMLPLGGPVAYKGYCLSLIVEILGGALSGQGCAAAGLVRTWEKFYCPVTRSINQLKNVSGRVFPSMTRPGDASNKQVSISD